VKDLLVGLDIGTSSVKAGVFDSNGRKLASASIPVEILAPQPGWAEQDPQAWWQASRQALLQIAKNVQQERIGAIGLAGQCPSHVLVDVHGQAIGRAIIWRDRRAQAEADWIRQQISPDQAREYLGTETTWDAASPPARLLWLKALRPGDWKSAVAILQPKDYIALHLTGQTATDLYSAYNLANPTTGEYAEGLFSNLGIDLAKMPPLCKPIDRVGEVSGTASQITGLPAGTPVIAGTIDAFCDTLAGGVACPGRAVDVAGTSEIVSLEIKRKVTALGIFPWSLENQVTFLCGPMQAGGETLRWLARNFFPESGENPDYSCLELEAGSVPPGSEGVVFLPYLDGERTPLWDASARGCFYGLSFRHRRGHFLRAGYEGVAFAVRHVLELEEEASGLPAEKIVACGGGSLSDFWNQVKADVLKRPVYPTEYGETGCLGAVILASVGMQIYPNLIAASQAMVRLKEGVPPDLEQADVYDQGYERYRELYPALRNISNLRVKRCSIAMKSN